MKKYIITSGHFSGKVEVQYDETGLLTFLNMNCFIGSSRIKQVLLYQIPYHLQKLLNVNLTAMFTIQEVQP